MEVSVALCTYNGAPYIRDQLDSILAQTFPPSEIVICDDGSSDETIDILKEYRTNYSNIVNIHLNEQNIGTTKNFEKCIRSCSGDMIALSDQDDVWKKTKIQRQIDAMQETGASLAFHNTTIANEDLNKISDYWSSISYTPGLVEDVELSVRDLLRRNFMTGHTIMFRSQLKDALLPIPETWIYDYYIAILSVVTGGVIDIDDCLAKHRYHEGQTTGAQLPSLTTLSGIRRGIETSFQENAQHLTPQRWAAIYDDIRQIDTNKLAIEKSNLLNQIENRWSYEYNRSKIYDRDVRISNRIKATVSNFSSRRYHKYENAHPLLLLLKDLYSCSRYVKI